VRRKIIISIGVEWRRRIINFSVDDWGNGGGAIVSTTAVERTSAPSLVIF